MSPKFERVKEKSNYCNSENFNRFKAKPSAQVRSQEFDFEHFIDHVFTKFIGAFIQEMISAFLQLKFWSVFDILTLENFCRV